MVRHDAGEISCLCFSFFLSLLLVTLLMVSPPDTCIVRLLDERRLLSSFYCEGSYTSFRCLSFPLRFVFSNLLLCGGRVRKFAKHTTKKHPLPGRKTSVGHVFVPLIGYM